MPAGLTEPPGAAAPVVASASGTVSMAPAAALPVRVESAPGALGPVTKAPPGSVCVESVAPQPLPSPVGTLVTKVVPVTALPKLGSPRLPAPQIVTVKTPGTTTIQLPANLQLPPGMFITSARQR